MLSNPSDVYQNTSFGAAAPFSCYVWLVDTSLADVSMYLTRDPALSALSGDILREVLCLFLLSG